nr:cobw domain-containing protein [Quercus suber]
MEDPLDLPDNATILANKKAHPLFARLFRSKGEFWLATRPNRAGEWSQAGAMLTLQGGRAWFCTLERAAWATGVREIDELVEHDMAQGGAFGDRRQELVFIGEQLDTAGIRAALDACVLDDAEWAAWRGVMMPQGADGGPNSADKEALARKMPVISALSSFGVSQRGVSRLEESLHIIDVDSLSVPCGREIAFYRPGAGWRGSVLDLWTSQEGRFCSIVLLHASHSAFDHWTSQEESRPETGGAYAKLGNHSHRALLLLHAARA